MISVIIPVYNADTTIINALNSIRNQTISFRTFEIIIINDGSTDGSKIKVENYMKENPEMNIHLINQPNQGVSKARNTGLKRAKGDYIALLDSDDEWLPEKTERQMFFFRNDNVDFLATVRNNSKILFPYQVKNNLAEITFEKLLIRNEAQPSTVIFKNKIIENTGYFDDNQRYAEDVNFWMKISFKNKMYIVNESLVIAGGGKRTFGVSGLSANLFEMKKGFQKNLYEMYTLKKINPIQYLILMVFYQAKYLFLRSRLVYYKVIATKN